MVLVFILIYGTYGLSPVIMNIYELSSFSDILEILTQGMLGKELTK